MSNLMDKLYFLGKDNSGHNYLVLAKFRDQWEDWLEVDEDDPESWDAPEFAKMIGTNISRVEFCLKEDVFGEWFLCQC